MLQSLARSLLPACHRKAVSAIRMSQPVSTATNAAVQRQPAETISAVAVTSPQSVSLRQSRRSSRIRSKIPQEGPSIPTTASTAQSSPQTVQQNNSAEAADIAVSFASDPPAAKVSRARKRKQPETPSIKIEKDSPALSAPGGVKADSTQPAVAVTDSPASRKPHQRRAKAPVKLKTASETASAALPQSAEVGNHDLVDNKPKPCKQQKPLPQVVIKTETISVSKPANVPTAEQEPFSDASQPTLPTSSSKKSPKQQEPKSTKVVMKTEAVVMTESTYDDVPSPQQSAADTTGKAKKKSPRKPRAKATVSIETLLESVDVVPYRERVVPKRWVGAHVSMAGGLERAVVRAASIGLSNRLTQSCMASTICPCVA